jgi:NAD dependent epimerase/dehydratase
MPATESDTDSPPASTPARQRVLVTGAGGFIGSHLVEECVAQGWQVRALVRYNSRNHWGWLEESARRSEIEVITGDVRDYDSVVRAMKGCETVFHLAALIGIPYSYVSPLAYIRTNVEGTYNILESARNLEVKKVLITSTSETYGTAQYVPIDERHPAVGQSPYAATKVAADQLALSYHRSFALPVRVVRPFNTFGPRQSARAFIPTVISQILHNQRPLRLGNLAPTRDYTYVKDTASAFVALARSDQFDGLPVNVGLGSEISMEKLVHKIAQLMGAEVNVTNSAERMRPAASEVERLVCDPSRMRALTSWQPRYDLDAGLRETIDWIRAHPDSFKVGSYIV